ncbi:MAG: winged helix-turn-helix transcriptional regulator [Acidimicrobiales bacterium]|nr:winged helix-turn-helix transcriptional regulator [Acidimicrobiales bacterium]
MPAPADLQDDLQDGVRDEARPGGTEPGSVHATDATDATEATEATELAGQLRVVVARLARILRQQDQSGLAPTLLAALTTVGRSGPLTFGELAAHEQVAAPTVTKAVQKLEAKGLVSRRPDPDDGRVCRVVITAAGRRHLERARRRRTAWLATRLTELEADDVRRLAAAVDVLEALTNAEAPASESTAT